MLCRLARCTALLALFSASLWVSSLKASAIELVKVMEVAGEASRIGFLPNGRWLSVSPGSLLLWEGTRPEKRSNLQGFPNLVVSSDALRVWGTRQALYIKDWRLDPQNLQEHIAGKLAPGTVAERWHVAPDELHAAIISTWRPRGLPRKKAPKPTHQRHIHILHLPTKKIIKRMSRNGNVFVAWSSKQAAIAGLEESDKISILSRMPLKKISEAKFQGGYINALFWDPQGQRLFAKNSRRSAEVFDSTGQRIAQLQTKDQIWSWDLSADGRFLVLGTGHLQQGRNRIELWRIKDHPKLVTQIELERRPELIRVHPDGRVFAGLIDSKPVADHRIAAFSIQR